MAERRAAVVSCGLSLRSEEHTSELQSPCNLVCRLLLEKKERPDQHERFQRLGLVWGSDEPSIVFETRKYVVPGVCRLQACLHGRPRSGGLQQGVVQLQTHSQFDGLWHELLLSRTALELSSIYLPGKGKIIAQERRR